MSCNYAEGLSPYANKGKCGMPERFDNADVVETKVDQLARIIQNAGHVVVHTGAGVSTAAGIPDFRGPNGVWTLEKQGRKPEMNTSWEEAKPTVTHMALAAMEKQGYVQYVVTQNIDGLHLKSGLPRARLSELHGNMFIHQCGYCKRQFVRSSSVATVGEKCLNLPCPAKNKTGRGCRGKLFDTILDWEGSLPDKDLELAETHSSVADVSLCLGTTLQIVPSGNLPTLTRKNGGKLVICNLQPTKHDRKADLIINAYVDDVMIQLAKSLGLKIPDYDGSDDPTKKTVDVSPPIEWTIPEGSLKNRTLQARVKEMKQKTRDVKQQKKRPCDASSGKNHKLHKTEPGQPPDGGGVSSGSTESTTPQKRTTVEAEAIGSVSGTTDPDLRDCERLSNEGDLESEARRPGLNGVCASDQSSSLPRGTVPDVGDGRPRSVSGSPAVDSDSPRGVSELGGRASDDSDSVGRDESPGNHLGPAVEAPAAGQVAEVGDRT